MHAPPTGLTTTASTLLNNLWVQAKVDGATSQISAWRLNFSSTQSLEGRRVSCKHLAPGAGAKDVRKMHARVELS